MIRRFPGPVLCVDAFQSAFAGWQRVLVLRSFVAVFVLTAMMLKSAAADIVVPVDNGQTKALLTKIVNIEIYFIRKVAAPTDEQIAAIRAAGDAAVNDLLPKLNRPQRFANQPQQVDVRGSIVEALMKKIDEVLPAEAAKTCREEITARQAARRQAVIGIMLVHLDQQLMLSPDQYDKVAQLLEENWVPQWERNLGMGLHLQYCILPDSATLAAALNEEQLEVLKRMKANTTQVSFGIEIELGLGNLGIELPNAPEKPDAK